MEREAKGETQLTREQLFELVWSEPMQVLGPRYGMSDVGLKKACKRLRVPTPGRGYWAMKAAGRPPRRPVLPKLPESVPASQRSLTLGRPPKSTPAEVAQATGPVPDQERFEAVPENRIVVPEELTQPHALVQATVKLLRNAKSDQQHRLVPRGKMSLAVAVTLGTADRAMLIYDALLKACDARGWPVAVTEGQQGSSTTITIGSDPVGIFIEERVDRIERKREPKAGHVYYGKEYEYTPTGRLTVRLMGSYLGGVRQTWSDGAKQRVEDCLNGIMVGLVAASEFLKARRLEFDARQREYAAAEQRRREAEQRRQREAARVRALDADLVAWRKAAVVRQYAAELRSAAAAAELLGDGTPMTSWLSWVEQYADGIDPTVGTPSVPNDPQPNAWPSGYGNQSSDPRPLW